MDVKSKIILGPTAVGKSALALELAERCGGEIISLDSMQIYIGMDIGTAKPSPEELKICPHHLIDTQQLDKSSDVATFLNAVKKAEQKILNKNSLPILVGGTAMYIKNLVDGLFEGPGASEEIRSELLNLAEEKGSQHLHEEILKSIDSIAAEKIHPNDLRRIIRAIEVFKITGKPISASQTQWPEKSEDINYNLIGLTLPRGKLYQKINERVDLMIEAGLENEVRMLKENGIEKNKTASQAIGYKELLAYLNGEYNFERAVELIKRNTRRFAKHQLTWFRKDERIKWFDVENYVTVKELADEVLKHACTAVALPCGTKSGI